MEKETKEIKITFRIDICKILSFSATYNQELEKKNYESDYTFEISINQEIDKSKKTVSYKSDVKIYLDLKKEIFLGDISTLNVFSIMNFDELVNEKDGNLILPLPVASTLLGLSFSNTRGMLVAKSEGTSMQKVILPIMNPIKFITEGVIN